jgi:L-iditol 2-dehydrogenase
VKALRLHAPGDLRLHDEPESEVGPGEVLLRVTSVGLCGSDRHWLVEGGIGDAVLARPLVLGHEFAATIESGPRAGERVAVDPAIPCGACASCAAGLQHLCPDVEFAGSNASASHGDQRKRSEPLGRDRVLRSQSRLKG